MNVVDVLIIVTLVLFGVNGLHKSFFSQLLDFLAFIIAFLAALSFYGFVAQFFESNFLLARSIANVLGFLIIWFIVETVLFFALHFWLHTFKFIHLVDQKLRRFSFIPSLLRGLVFIVIILVMIASFPVQPGVKQAVLKSRIASIIISQTYQLEAPIKNVFGGISQDTFSFFTVKPKSDQTVDLGFETTEFSPNMDLENQMVGLVNMERAKQGVKTLTFDEKLRDVGRIHSSDMFKRGYFSHYSPEKESVAERAMKAEVDYFVIGENLAYAPDLKLAHDGLMNSPGHRANIMSEDFNKIGIGIQDGGVYGLMVTQVFSDE